jgi:hypothetical protein
MEGKRRKILVRAALSLAYTLVGAGVDAAASPEFAEALGGDVATIALVGAMLRALEVFVGMKRATRAAS